MCEVVFCLGPRDDEYQVPIYARPRAVFDPPRCEEDAVSWRDARTIDHSTKIPQSIYIEFLEAGKQARGRAQHQLRRETPSGVAALVRTPDEGELILCGQVMNRKSKRDTVSEADRMGQELSASTEEAETRHQPFQASACTHHACTCSMLRSHQPSAPQPLVLHAVRSRQPSCLLAATEVDDLLPCELCRETLSSASTTDSSREQSPVKAVRD